MGEKIKTRQHKSKCESCKTHLDFDMPIEIIEAVKKNELVIFAGAGVSTEGKSCFRSSFYQDVKSDLKLFNEDISFSEIMSLYCKQVNGRKKLIQRIKKRFDYVEAFPELYRAATRFHSELATIHFIREIITTNWDDYFEKECGAIPFVTGEDVAFWSEANRKVLKIHGSINNFGTLIMTKEDYNKCYSDLNMGNIGAILKSLLATKVIVYVGYSFGDEDFNKIYDYLVKDMNGLYPHAYMVTLDERGKEKFSEKNITTIITDGAHFVHTLKENLIEDNYIINDIKYDLLGVFLDKYRKIHEDVRKRFELLKYPQVLYTLYYQDGLIHSLERIQAKKKTGEYSCKGCMLRLIKNYQERRKAEVKRKNYIDASYIDGYVTPLYYLIQEEISDFDVLNPFYLYGYGYIIENYDDLTSLIKSKDIYNLKAYKMAVKYIEESHIAKGVSLHHPPFL